METQAAQPARSKRARRVHSTPVKAWPEDKQKEYKSELGRHWYQENKEHVKDNTRKWRAANPERTKELRREEGRRLREQARMFRALGLPAVCTNFQAQSPPAMQAQVPVHIQSPEHKAQGNPMAPGHRDALSFTTTLNANSAPFWASLANGSLRKG